MCHLSSSKYGQTGAEAIWMLLVTILLLHTLTVCPGKRHPNRSNGICRWLWIWHILV